MCGDTEGLRKLQQQAIHCDLVSDEDVKCMTTPKKLQWLNVWINANARLLNSIIVTNMMRLVPVSTATITSFKDEFAKERPEKNMSKIVYKHGEMKVELLIANGWCKSVFFHTFVKNIHATKRCVNTLGKRKTHVESDFFSWKKNEKLVTPIFWENFDDKKTCYQKMCKQLK